MDVSSINSDLIRGNVTTIILKALMTEDRYGYDILKEIEVKSGGQYKLKQPTLYSCLKRLEKQGLINSYWGAESDTEGGRRRYYALTESGRTYLNKMQSEYEYSRTILDNLLSEEKFDFDKQEAPFDINSLRPYSKRGAEEYDVKSEKPTITISEPVDKISVASSKPEAVYINNSNELTNKKDNISDKNLFTPLDKGQGSYDQGYRHSAKSVLEMLGEIDEIMSKKPVQDASATEEKSEKTELSPKPIDKQISPAQENEDENNKTSVNKNDSPLFINENKSVVSTSPVDLAAEKEKRDSAKRALGIGVYKDNFINIEEPKKEDEKQSILGQIDKLVDGNVDEKKEERKFDLFSKIPIDQQLHPEKYQQNTTEDIKSVVPTSAEPKNDPKLIFDKYNKKEEVREAEKESVKVALEPSPVPPASTFSFRQDKDSVVNYRDAFGGLRNSDALPKSDTSESDLSQKPASSIDLKTKLFSQGYKLRTYSRENTENYYSMNFLKQNKINRDCYAIMYVLICLEVLFGWIVFKDRFSPIAYVTVCIAALLVPAIPFVIWTVNPDKRVRGNYNFRTSILNRCMLYLNLLVIDCLIGFFGVGANIKNGASMVAPILIPALLLLNIPLSSVVYLVLYKTKRYHIS